MKTLLVTLEYKPFKGGVAKYYSSIFENWPNKDIFVLCPKSEKDIEESSRIIRKNIITPLFSWFSFVFILNRQIKKNKINHIIVGHILPLGTVVWFLSYFINIRYSVILHGMDYAYSQKKKRKKKISKKILSRAENIICGNTYLRNNILKDYPYLKNKIEIVNPGIDYMSLKDEENKNQNVFNLFFVGRLVERKGIDRVIKAIELIDKNKYPGVNYIIAGAGPDEARLKKMSHDSRIKFVGNISDDEKWEYLSDIDVFIMTSRNIKGDYEGFGITYLEANLAGKPVIANNSGGVSDAVVNGLNGILLDDDSAETIKNAIIELYLDKGYREKLGRQGRKRVLDNFSWKKKVLKINNILNK